MLSNDMLPGWQVGSLILFAEGLKQTDENEKNILPIF